MNLLQIQDQLKTLPSDPRTMQMLASYANGGSPAVPPYLALGELNRRKQLMEQAQAAQASQPPQGTVKDQIAQQAGIMALQQGQQQQGMQQMMQGAGQQMGQVPPQVSQQGPVQAARGGLLDLLMAAKARNAKRMNSGGIIAFSEGSEGGINEQIRRMAEEGEAQQRAEAEASEGDVQSLTGAGTLANLNRANRLARQQMERLKTPELTSAQSEAERLAAENPERYGYLREAPDAAPLSRLEEFQKAKLAEFAKQREEAKANKPGILQLLGQAAMDSRGQYGRSALATILGGYSKASAGEDNKALKAEQDLRMKELELQQVKMDVTNKLQEAKRAYDEGNIGKAIQLRNEAAKIAYTHKLEIAKSAGKTADRAATLAGKIGESEIDAAAKLEAIKAKPPKTLNTTDLEDLTKLHLNALVAEGADPTDPKTQLLAAQRAARELSKSAGSVRAESDQQVKANEVFENRVLTDRELRKLRTTDPQAYKARVETMRKQIETEFGIRPNSEAPTPSTASAASSAPAATAPITPAEFNAQWAKLQSGEKLRGPDGKIYVKK